LGFNRPFDSVTLQIAFDTRTWPDRVWKMTWTDVEGTAKDVERVALDRDGTASWHLESATLGKLYGFRWESR
jgi:hypothetical protein